MSFSFSQPQTSSFLSPNQLLDLETLANAPQVAADVHQNRMLEAQGRQRDISAFDMEQAGRIAGSVLDETTYPTPEARAAAYPTLVARARANGAILPHAPDTYPGDDAMRSIVRMAVPAKELYAQGVDRTAKSAIAPGDGTAGTGGTGGSGGGTGAVGGADTTPINAAGDSRTRKAAEGGPPAPGSPGHAVAQRVHDFWRGKGFSEETTAGIMAGGPGSESDFNPSVYGDKGTSIGLYQHHGPRADGMRAFFSLGPGQMPTADQQNQYAYWEITQGPLKNVGEMLKTAKTPAEAAAIWTQYFGVPADKSEIGRRAAGAQRFVGLYGGQPGAPGSPQTPPGVTMGQVGDQTAPAPPGGTPGAYPAYGGGMGAVIGGQPAAARATIPAGRPTGPPVVTDQPAGSNVVAGPPGVATVGAPQPPGPAVPGNVAAINAGIAGAGGQPVTDPNVTPTPARYAGTAPAPSVEAAPQPGWGTQVGSGYGPQNALAPAPVPPAPAQPATPAAPVATATQPPAADTLPPLPAPTPPAPTNRNGLTAFQQLDINRRRTMPNVSADELQKRVDSYVATNAAAAEKFQQDQLAYMKELRERQSTAGTAEQRRIENQRQADTAVRQAQAAEDAHAKALRDAANEGKLEQSKSDLADSMRVMQAIAPKIRAGIDLTPEEADQYDLHRHQYAKGPLQIVGDGKGGTVQVYAGQEVPDRFPPLPGQKEYAGLKPIPGTEKQPDFAPANAITAMLDVGEGQRKIMRALENLKKYPGGVGLIAGSQPAAMSNWTDPAGVDLRADIGDVKAHIYHTLSGSAVTSIEEPRLQRFTPQEIDNAPAVKKKLERMLELNRETQLDHYRAFGPEAGGRRNPAVEDSILATIPQESIDAVREDPKRAQEFDKKYGRGASKVALSNG